MARRSSSKLSSPRFLTIVVLAISAVALVVFTIAAQKPTNTKSDAFLPAPCSYDPTWRLEDTTDKETGVVYHLKLKSNCLGDHNYKLSVIETPTQPYNVSDWGWKFANGQQNTPYVKPNVGINNTEVNLTVSRPGAWRGPGYAKDMREGQYYWIVVKASLVENPSASATIRLYYNIENP